MILKILSCWVTICVNIFLKPSVFFLISPQNPSGSETILANRPSNSEFLQFLFDVILPYFIPRRESTEAEPGWVKIIFHLRFNCYIRTCFRVSKAQHYIRLFENLKILYCDGWKGWVVIFVLFKSRCILGI